MGRKRVEGKCRICGVEGKLSFEHVPPESAFNDRPVLKAKRDQMLSGELWDGQRGIIQQRGAGEHTLCEHCNNNTGSWYGTEYARWAEQGARYLDAVPPEKGEPVRFRFVGKPLRFLKQVMTMFFSVNELGFADKHEDLVRFVLDWRTNTLPPKYKIDMVLVRGGFFRSSGLHGLVDLTSGTPQVGSEIAHFPFAHRLILSERTIERLGPIEHFAEFGADDEAEVWLPLVVGHVATKFPGDFRSREQVQREAAGA